MLRSATRLVAACLAAILLAPAEPAHANKDGIYGYSGKTSSRKCNSCHGGGTFSATAALDGPATLAPGTTGAFTVRMNTTTPTWGGFDLSGSGGTLASTDAGVKLLITELTHTAKRASNASNVVTWNFTWTAASAGTYTLYVCTLPTNNNNSESRDGPQACTTKSITVAAANQPPAISGLNATPSYTENAAALVLDPTLALTDPDDTDAAAAAVALTTNFRPGEDILDCPVTTLTCAYDASSGVLSLSGAAPLSTYQAALTQVAYRNLSEAPSGLTRSLEFSLTDPHGAKTTAPLSLAVVPVNDPPVLLSTAPVRAFDSRPFRYVAVVSDPDDANDGTSLAFSLSGAPAGMTISPTGVIDWIPPSGSLSSGNVTVTVADGGEDAAAPATQPLSLTVLPDAAMAALPDVNGGGSPDTAVLVKNGSGLKLVVKDGTALGSIALIDLGTGRGEATLAAPADLDGDGRPDLAVLSRALSNDALRVDLRDAATGASMGSFPALTAAYTPVGLTAVPDLDASGKPEIATLGHHRTTGANLVRIVEPSTATALASMAVLTSAEHALAVRAVPDVDANGVPEIAVLGRNDTLGTGRIQVRDALAGTLLRTIKLPSAAEPVGLLVAADRNGNGAAELATLMYDRATKRPRVLVHDAATGALLRNQPFFTGGVTTQDFAMLPDQTADGVEEIAVLVADAKGMPRVQAIDGATGAILLDRQAFLSTLSYPAGLAQGPDGNGNGIADLSVLGTAVTGVQVQSRDALLGTLVRSLPIP